MNSMKTILKKIFSPSNVTPIVCVILAMAVISCTIAFAPKPTADEPETDSEITRVVAPEDMVDTYARPAVPNGDVVTIQFPTFVSPEVTEQDTSLPRSDTAAEITVAETVPETTVIETTAPETLPETESETTAAETMPETTAETVAETTAAETQKNTAEGTLLADKYKVKYTISKPSFKVSEHELELAAAVIQLEVMGGGSKVDAFEDTTEKYDEMLSVAEVIRNRVDSDRFPNTVEEVINQKVGGVAQFSPVENLEKTLKNGKVTEGAFAAAREVLVDGVMVKPANLCYFCATNRKAYFEKSNAAALVPDGNGSYVQWEGHLTTFYAGNINSDK